MSDSKVFFYTVSLPIWQLIDMMLPSWRHTLLTLNTLLLTGLELPPKNQRSCGQGWGRCWIASTSLSNLCHVGDPRPSSSAPLTPATAMSVHCYCHPDCNAKLTDFDCQTQKNFSSNIYSTYVIVYRQFLPTALIKMLTFQQTLFWINYILH